MASLAAPYFNSAVRSELHCQRQPTRLTERLESMTSTGSVSKVVQGSCAFTSIDTARLDAKLLLEHVWTPDLASINQSINTKP